MAGNPGATGGGLHYGALPAGYPLGAYRVQSVLGIGGFGITYRAIDERLRRPVAVKEFLPRDFAVRVGGSEVRPRSPSDQEMFAWGLARFLDEARVLAALRDAPNVVEVHNYLEANGTGYMVMELIEGEPLDKLLARVGRIAARNILPLLPSLLQGLDAVHRAGYLHRDIKPANVLVRTTGEPVLVDFGAARVSLGQRNTQVMTSIYSPGYAPPEQYAEAGGQGPWTDIYAMAATLHHAITGAAPADAVRRLVKDTYVPLTQVAAGHYPPGFLAAIDAALSLPVERRPQSVTAWAPMLLGDARTRAHTAAPVSASTTAAPAAGRAPASRRTVWIVAAALVLVLAAAGTYVAVRGTGTPDDDIVSQRACYAELARVNAEIERLLEKLPGRTVPRWPGLACPDELARAKAELHHLQQLPTAGSSGGAPQSRPPSVEPKPPVIEPKPPVVEPRPATGK